MKINSDRFLYRNNNDQIERKEQKGVVEIFKTDVNEISEAGTLKELLQQSFPYCKINFDLQDCDKILRIEDMTGNLEIHLVLKVVESQGYFIERID